MGSIDAGLAAGQQAPSKTRVVYCGYNHKSHPTISTGVRLRRRIITIAGGGIL